MGRINWMEDLGAPLVVTGIDLVVESTAPQWDEWAAYGTAAFGWLAESMGWTRGNFAKNMAIAATPWAAKKLYQRVRGMMGVTGGVNRLTARKVSRYPAPIVEQPFGGARLI